MNLLKKLTASVALVALVSGLFSNTTFADINTSELEAAKILAEAGVIVNQNSDTKKYNLGSNVLRQEIAAVAMKIAKLEKKDTCEGKFTDVSATKPNSWACGVVESLRDADLIAKNAKFNPEKNITKAEAIGMIVKAAFGDDYKFDSSKGTTWQEQVVDFAVSKGMVEKFTNYNTKATRGFVFNSAVVDNKVLQKEEDTTDIDIDGELCKLMGTCGNNTEVVTPTEPTNTGSTANTGTTETPVVSGKDVLQVELSPETPKAATIPGDIDGLAAAKFVFTAGNTDVTVKSLTVKRKGLSDKDTLTGIAAFSKEGRISKSKNDSQENNTEAVLNLDNGGFVIKAGEEQIITLVVDVNDTKYAGNDEFALELTKVEASSNVDMASNLIASTMRVGWVNAAKITIEKDGTVSDVKVGEKDAEIFKFKIEGDDDSDVALKAITFKWSGTIDEEDDLANFKLKYKGKVVAEASRSNGKYVTFNLTDELLIKEDKTEKFSVTADILSGAKKDIQFEVSKNLDVTAIGKKYGFGSAVVITNAEMPKIDVDAGEISLSSVDAPADKIRADKKDVVLGSVKVTNVSGNEVELKRLWVEVVVSSGTLANTFENFEAVINDTNYELELKGSIYSDKDLDITLPKGTSTITFRADTKKGVTKDTTVDLKIKDFSDNFRVEETEDDNEVKDISPSSLTFRQVKFIDAGATASNVVIATNIDVVKGVKDTVVAKFEIQAEEASAIEIDEIVANVSVQWVTFDNNTNQPNKFVSQLALYKGSVSESNLLDKVTGTKVSTSGEATFNWFRTKIEANKTQTYIITMDVVDWVDVQNKKISVNVKSINAIDDDSDNITIGGLPLASNRQVSVTSEWSLVASYDSNNTDNKETKTILAWNTVTVASYDVSSQKEKMDVEEVTFTLNNSVKDITKKAILYLGNKKVGETMSKDILVDNTTGVKEVSTLTVNTAATSNGNAKVTLNGATYNIPVKVNSNDGKKQKDTLTVNTAATTAGNVTVTLNGTPQNIAVSIAGTAQPEISILTINSAAAQAGKVQINVNGTSKLVDLAANDDANTIATKIAAQFSDGAAVNNVVTFTSTDNKDYPDLTFNPGSTFVTAGTNSSTSPAQQGVGNPTHTTAKEIADGINGVAGFTASSSGAVVTIERDTVGAQSNTTFVAGTTGAAATVANVTAGEAVAAASTASTASDLKTGIDALANYTATVSANLVTITAADTGVQENTKFDAGTTGAAATAATLTEGTNSSTTIKFDKMSELIVPTDTVELKLALETNNIGYELPAKKGVKDVQVTKVAFSKVDWVSSNNLVTVADITDSSERFNIVPAKLVVSRTKSMNSAGADFKITVDSGNNKKVDENAGPRVEINQIKFSRIGSTAWKTFVITDKNDAAKTTNAASDTFDSTNFNTLVNVLKFSGYQEFTVAWSNFANDETMALKVLKNGIKYTVNGVQYTMNMNEDIDLWSAKK